VQCVRSACNARGVRCVPAAPRSALWGVWGVERGTWAERPKKAAKLVLLSLVLQSLVLQSLVACSPIGTAKASAQRSPGGLAIAPATHMRLSHHHRRRLSHHHRRRLSHHHRGRLSHHHRRPQAAQPSPPHTPHSAAHRSRRLSHHHRRPQAAQPSPPQAAQPSSPHAAQPWPRGARCCLRPTGTYSLLFGLQALTHKWIPSHILEHQLHLLKPMH
jgi:hypothetical protein